MDANDDKSDPHTELGGAEGLHPLSKAPSLLRGDQAVGVLKEGRDCTGSPAELRLRAAAAAALQCPWHIHGQGRHSTREPAGNVLSLPPHLL